MQAPQLTVFLPVHNGEAFVAEAIESVLQQDGPSFELLVIDDHSTDSTPDILARYAATDSRVRTLRNDTNLGVWACANIALDEARGKYLLRIDADDASLPSRHRVQYELLESGAAQVVGSSVEAFGKRTGRVPYPTEDGAIKAKLITCANNIANPSSAIDLAFVRGKGLRFSPERRVAGDLHFWIDCMLAGATFRNVEQPLVRYRIHGGQSYVRHPKELHRARAQARARLLEAWFPQLPLPARKVLAAFIGGGRLQVPMILAGIGAVDVVLADLGPSRHGEDRGQLAAILSSYRDAAIRALR